jgi:hypothetical protein
VAVPPAREKYFLTYTAEFHNWNILASDAPFWALPELFSPLGHQIDIKYKDMSSLEKPVGISSLVGVGGKTERTTRALK